MMEKLLDIAGVGGTVVLILLLVLSVISIGIIIERFVYFTKRRVDATALGKQVLAKLEADDREGLIEMLKKQRSIEAAALAEALAWYDGGPEAFTEILRKGVTERRKDFEGGLVFLGTLGNNAPFVGLFGTVLGIIVSFRELSSAAANVAGGSGNMNNVMSGIAEALVSTAVGILVAVPAVIFFNIFQKKTVQIDDNVGSLGNIVVAQMQREREVAAVAKVAEGSAPTPRESRRAIASNGAVEAEA